MTEKVFPGPALTERTPALVGREAELELLQCYLHDPMATHVLYFWAPGGQGKTRLLQELQRMVADGGPGYVSSGIVDLYHTDLHSTSDIERAIVEGLDPEHTRFETYRRRRQEYERLREHGGDPKEIERQRKQLSRLFRQELKDLADPADPTAEARKLVLCFDTVELLQYESSVVEEMAGLEAMDARVKPWLLENLARLRNVLIVFAGRPRVPHFEEQGDAHKRLIADMRNAFGSTFEAHELKPFDADQTAEFLRVLSTDTAHTLVPADLVGIVHRLTEGCPIYLHLIVDLLQTLAPDPARILKLIRDNAHLANAADDDPALANARQRIRTELLRAFFNSTLELGSYLGQIAMMPKGIDENILREALGLTDDAARQLLEHLELLSFVKRFVAPPASARLHGERLFLHDEMYQLLTEPDVVNDLAAKERAIAHALAEHYYNPRITQLEDKIEQERRSAADAPAERIRLREEMQKLQVERLYYLLVWDPAKGYAEFQRLADEANGRRWVGFGMRLLDEFLRFYNNPRRRPLFAAVCLPHDHIVRESALMWVERFHWWGQYDRAVALAEKIIKNPGAVRIRPAEDTGILGNIVALWARGRALLQHFDAQALEDAQAWLRRLPDLDECSPVQRLARARLAVSIGYLQDLGGMTTEAIAAYEQSLAAFRMLDTHRAEYAMVLNNVAYARARQGQFDLARRLGHEALEMNEQLGYEYATGLSLSTLANVALLRGSYDRAIEYAEEALQIAQKAGSAHAIAKALSALARAKRRQGQHETRLGRHMGQVREVLKAAQSDLETARQMLRDATRPDEGAAEKEAADIDAEMGRALRDLGAWEIKMENIDNAKVYYRDAKVKLCHALDSGKLLAAERADVLHDLAEVEDALGNGAEVEKRLAEVEEIDGGACVLSPGGPAPSATQCSQFLLPLGRVELLRGRIDMRRKLWAEGMRHYARARAYFTLFSPNAPQLAILEDDGYSFMRTCSAEARVACVQAIDEIAAECNYGVDMQPLVELIKTSG